MIQAAPLDYTGRESSFGDRVAFLLARSDCRLATSGERREMIFRLRQTACTRARSLSRHPFPSDHHDYAANAYLLGLHIDAELASSIRLHVASTRHDQLPSLEVFDDAWRSELDAGQIIIDCTRFVADEHLSRVWRELPYATIRMCVLAAEHFGADYLTIAASPPHEEFYRRAFNFKAISEPRLCGNLAVRLLSLSYRTEAKTLYRRYPFFRSTTAERRNLFVFGEWSSVHSQSAHALM